MRDEFIDPPRKDTIVKTCTVKFSDPRSMAHAQCDRKLALPSLRYNDVIFFPYTANFMNENAVHAHACAYLASCTIAHAFACSCVCGTIALATMVVTIPKSK